MYNIIYCTGKTVWQPSDATRMCFDGLCEAGRAKITITLYDKKVSLRAQ